MIDFAQLADSGASVMLMAPSVYKAPFDGIVRGAERRAVNI
jgi:hypothetical protein